MAKGKPTNDRGFTPPPAFDTDDFELPGRGRKPPPKPLSPAEKSLRFFRDAQNAYGNKKKVSRANKTAAPMNKAGKKPKIDKKPKAVSSRTPKPFLNAQSTQRIGIGAVGLIVLALAVMITVNLTRQNALAVYLDETLIGYILIDRDLDAENIRDQAVRHLELTEGAAVRVEGQVEIRPTRTRNQNIVPRTEVVSRLSSSFTHELVAAAIYVNGQRIAVLRTREDADFVASQLKEPFETENTIRSEFTEDFQIRNIYVDVENEILDTPQDALFSLDRPTREIYTHIIRPGDMLGTIAIAFNTTVDNISALNNITTGTILRAGDPLLVERNRSFLPVRTIDEITQIEELPMETQTLENPTLHHSITNEINPGRVGEQEIVIHITRIDGVQYGEPQVARTRVLREPETQILEVGTSATAITRR